MSIPKTPLEFDYDLWTTEDGKCMVRIKATGEVTEVERTVMQVLRSEEKRLRRASSSEQGPNAEGKSPPTVLSLDVLPEDVTGSRWLVDTCDYAEEISTKLLEKSLRESLTPTQYGIYQACILNGVSYKAYYPIDDDEDDACDFECRCGYCCGCCSDEDGDEDDEDIEEFAEVMTELVSHIHSIFGNNVTFNIVID